MAFFEWNSKLDIGVDKMNDEHQVLIKCMNDLHDLSERGAEKQQILATIHKLFDLTEKHFSDEEKFQEQIGYPGLNTHKVIHKNLLRELKNHADAYEAGTENKMDQKFFNFLKLWLSAHIQGIDMQYGDFYKGKAA